MTIYRFLRRSRPSVGSSVVRATAALGVLAYFAATAGATAHASTQLSFSQSFVATGSPVRALGKLRGLEGVKRTELQGGGIALVASNPSAQGVSLLEPNSVGEYSLAGGSPVPTGGGDPEGLVSGSSFEPPENIAGNAGFAVANEASNTVSVLGINSEKSAAPFEQAPGSPYPSGGLRPVAVGAYVYGPRAEDGLVVANSGDGSVAARVGGLEMPGLPAVAPGSPYATGLTAPSALALGTFGPAPVEDVVVVDGSGRSASNVAVLLGNAHGGFSLAPGSPFQSGGSQPDAVVAGDFDDEPAPPPADFGSNFGLIRDFGEQDLAIANFASNTVSVLLSNGDGTFRQAPGSPFSSAGVGPSAITAWDLNGDGQLDLAVTNQVSNSVAVFLGDGSGRFQLAPGSPIALAGQAPDAIVAGDFDEDGLGDLAVGYGVTPGVSVLRNQSPPATFQPVGGPSVRANGTITETLRAPAPGVFGVTASERRPKGRSFIYGCGYGSAGNPGTVKLTVTPTQAGLRSFQAGGSLKISLHALFLRADESFSAGDIGDFGRLPTPKHKHKVIVHISRALGLPDLEPGTSRCPLPEGTS